MLMNFVDIRAQVVNKQNILKLNKAHLEFEGQKIIKELEELKDNLDCLNVIITELDNLTENAE